MTQIVWCFNMTDYQTAGLSDSRMSASPNERRGYERCEEGYAPPHRGNKSGNDGSLVEF